MACFAQWNLPDIKHLTGAKDKRRVFSVCFKRLLVISDRPWHATMSLPEGAKKIFTRPPNTSVAGKLLWTLSPGNWPKRAPYVIIYPPPGPTTAKPHPLPIIKKEKYTGLRGAFIRKTLPEAQRTQGIESISWVNLSPKIVQNWFRWYFLDL